MNIMEFSRDFNVVLFLLILTCSGNLVNSQGGMKVKLKTCCDLDPKRRNVRCDENINTNSGDVGAVWKVPKDLMSTKNEVEFSLTSEDLKCGGGVGGLSSYPLVNSPISFLPSGYLQVMIDEENPFLLDYFHTTQYCINGFSEDSIEIKTCKRHCALNEPCIQKCCPLDLVYQKLDITKQGSCGIPSPVKWSPRLFKNPRTPLTNKEMAKIQPWFTVRPPQSGWVKVCGNHTEILHLLPFHKSVSEALNVPDTMRHRILQSGEIVFWNHLKRKWETLNKTENYCVDGVVHGTKPTYNHEEEETFLMTCPVEPQGNVERDASVFYGVFASATCGFALVTVIVYFLLWEKQNVHGWTIMSHSTSVFFFFVFIATAHFTKNDEDARKSFGCLFTATMAHFFFISTFCWLTMISFDLWLTFRNLTLSKGKGVKRFIGYSIFGWGVPLFIVALSWTLETIYKDDDQSDVVIPMYGVQMCYMTVHAFGEYIYIPCAILMVMNIIFFVMTTIKLYEFKKSTRFATKSVQNDRQSYLLFVKLFFVVGILWIFEIISWAVDQADVKWYWQVLDSLNCLSPVAIFFIFVFKYDVISSLGSKYPVMKIICMPNMRILEWLRRTQARGGDESTALNMSKVNDTTMSKFSESSASVADTKA